MADSIAESARRASAGSWRKPRMKIYDYNQVSLNSRMHIKRATSNNMACIIAYKAAALNYLHHKWNKRKSE